MSVQLTFRASVDLRDALDDAANARGTSRAEVCRAAVARALDPPERISLEEALDLLDAKARAGNTAAIIKTVERLLAERRAGEVEASDAAADFGLRVVG